MTDLRLLLLACFATAFLAVLFFILGLIRIREKRHWLTARDIQQLEQLEKDDNGGLFANLRKEAAEAGLEVPPAHIFTALIAGMAAGFLGGMIVTGLPLFGLAGMLLGFTVPRWWVKKRIEGRAKIFEEQLEKALSVMVASLHAGSNTVQALEEAARQSQPPMKDVTVKTLSLMKTGYSLASALEEAGNSVKSRDMKTVASAVAINLKTGAKLVDVLEGVANGIRDRRSFKAQVAAKAAESNTAANVLAALPFVLLTVFHLMNPDYMAPLLHTTTGNIVLAWALGMFLLGRLLIRRMMTIEF